MKKWLVFLSILIVSVAVFLRFFRLGEVPVSLYWDEIAMLVDARSVAETALDMHGNSMWQAIFPSYGDYKLPVYIWFASLSVKLFGASEWSLRLPSAIAGVSTVIMGFLLAKELFNSSFINLNLGLKKSETKKTANLQKIFFALLVAGVIAISPWSVMFSRTAFEGHLAQFFVSLSVLFILKQKKHWSWGLLATFFGSLATYTYFSVRFLWPVLFVMTTLLFVWQNRKESIFKKIILLLILPLSLYFISLQPMLKSPLYAASNQFRLSTVSILNMENWPVVANKYKLQAGNNLLDKVTYHPYVLMGRELVKNYSDNMSFDFLFFSGDDNLRHGTGNHGLFLWIFIPSFIYGWYTLFQKHWKQGLLLLVWWIFALLPASVPETTPHALRSLNALMPLSLLIGWGSYRLFFDLNKINIFKKKINGKLNKLYLIFLAGIIIVIGAVVYDFSFYLFNKCPATSASSWQDGYKEVASIIWQEKEGRDTVFVQPFDSRFHLWVMGYQMPVSEFSETKFENWVPSKLSKNIVFEPFDWAKVLTMEPKVVLAGKKEEIDLQLELSPVQPTWYKEVKTADGDTPFVVIYFEK
ncbi:MAG: hypothetical protein HN981_00640 [Candidatus Pacebacteria bacterium]|jgi:4-amino-4-deoxy-L-arabinose transferase-like glycosyltransferase|nr:hypothetical protein [Candidatus Paceibacterota bacterium]MBT6756039.1 hypothetical protein [Candidatus Paceibacterota bacterium]MBT6920891.1 hypothetical protein [Candidatus Paceibacterota bacterium]